MMLPLHRIIDKGVVEVCLLFFMILSELESVRVGMALAGVLDAVGRNSGFGYRHWIGLGLADPIASIVGPSPSPSLSSIQSCFNPDNYMIGLENFNPTKKNLIWEPKVNPKSNTK